MFVTVNIHCTCTVVLIEVFQEMFIRRKYLGNHKSIKPQFQDTIPFTSGPCSDANFFFHFVLQIFLLLNKMVQIINNLKIVRVPMPMHKFIRSIKKNIKIDLTFTEHLISGYNLITDYYYISVYPSIYSLVLASAFLIHCK